MGVILAPVDIEDPSLAILRKACGLAHDLGDSLTLLYVYELPSYAYAEGTVLPATLPRRIEAAARDALEGAAAQLGGSGVSIEVRVEHGGHPAETIARCASELGCDLIVMATSDRSLPGHGFLGRVTDRVLRSSPCPVLTMRR